MKISRFFFLLRILFQLIRVIPRFEKRLQYVKVSLAIKVVRQELVLFGIVNSMAGNIKIIRHNIRVTESFPSVNPSAVKEFLVTLRELSKYLFFFLPLGNIASITRIVYRNKLNINFFSYV